MYETYIVGISPPSLDFNLVDGEGYWIYSTSARTLNLQGDYPTGKKTIKVDVPAGGGWALIGLTSLKTWRASDIFEMCTNGSISVVVGWNPASHVYESYFVGLPFTDFLIPPGRGFWIHCAQGTELTYDA